MAVDEAHEIRVEALPALAPPAVEQRAAAGEAHGVADPVDGEALAEMHGAQVRGLRGIPEVERQFIPAIALDLGQLIIALNALEPELDVVAGQQNLAEMIGAVAQRIERRQPGQPVRLTHLDRQIDHRADHRDRIDEAAEGGEFFEQGHAHSGFRDRRVRLAGRPRLRRILSHPLAARQLAAPVIDLGQGARWRRRAI